MSDKYTGFLVIDGDSPTKRPLNTQPWGHEFDRIVKTLFQWLRWSLALSVINVLNGFYDDFILSASFWILFSLLSGHIIYESLKFKVITSSRNKFKVQFYKYVSKVGAFLLICFFYNMTYNVISLKFVKEVFRP